VCTGAPGRIRISADVFDDWGSRETFPFSRRQPAGCKRHRLHTLGGDRFEEGGSYSRLKVRWSGRHRHTEGLNSSLSYPK
jgi:hypothetical protein